MSTMLAERVGTVMQVTKDVNMTTLKAGDYVVVKEHEPDARYFRVHEVDADANSGLWAVMPEDLQPTRKPVGWRLYARISKNGQGQAWTDHSWVTYTGTPNDLHVALATYLYRHNLTMQNVTAMIGPHQTVAGKENDHIWHHLIDA